MQQGIAECRQVGAGQSQFFEQALHLGVIGVKRTVTPAGIMTFVTVMNFIRVNQNQRTAGGKVFCAPIAITLSARHDHADHEAIVYVGHKTVLDVSRRQQFDARERRRLPEPNGLTLLTVHYVRPSRRPASHCGIRCSR